MRTLIITLAILGLIAAVKPAMAGLSAAGELAHARADARAGGPISGRDADLLNQYGCLSGTKSAFCRKWDRRRSRPRRIRRPHRD